MIQRTHMVQRMSSSLERQSVKFIAPFHPRQMGQLTLFQQQRSSRCRTCQIHHLRLLVAAVVPSYDFQPCFDLHEERVSPSLQLSLRNPSSPFCLRKRYLRHLLVTHFHALHSSSAGSEVRLAIETHREVAYGRRQWEIQTKTTGREEVRVGS